MHGQNHIKFTLITLRYLCGTIQYNTVQYNTIHDPKISEQNLSTKYDVFL